MRRDDVLTACARLVRDSDGTAADVERRLRLVFDAPRSHRWPTAVAAAIADRFAATGRPPLADAIASIADQPVLRRAMRRHRLAVVGFAPPARMWPRPGRPSAWSMPSWPTVAELARALACDADELRWLAGGFASGVLPPGPRHHYRYRWIAKASGGERLIEEPKDWLKAIQRRLAVALVDRLPAHADAHGFVPGRSQATFAAPHVGKHVVVRLDLQDFFPSITGRRVLGLLSIAGFPPRVAQALAGLCTNRVPSGLLVGRRIARDRFTTWHLPQGAPTSPGLANACCYRLDCRLAGLARAAGAGYTRYADDLVFSGDRGFAVHLERFLIRAEAILIAEGFAVKRRKTRVMRRGARQMVAGVVVNDRPRVPRRDRDRLRAILTNCVRHGPASQNRDCVADFRAHLLGRIGWVAQLASRDGDRLRLIFDRIDWRREG